MQTTNCSTCRWWAPLRSGIGSCELAGTAANQPEHAASRAVVVSDGTIGDGVLLTFHAFCCSQFSRQASEGASAPSGTRASDAAAAAASLVGGPDPRTGKVTTP